MGFRSDLYFLLPIGTVFLLIGFSDPKIKSIIGQVISRTKISIIFAAAFIIFASPILKNGGPGGVGGVFIMQGMSEPFRKNLKLEPASYTTGWSYSDELTLSSIAASEREKDPEQWDKKEQAGIPGISISQTMHLGTSNLLQWADLFIGDFSTQAIKSFTWIVGFPLYISNSGFALTNPYPDKSPEGLIYSGYQKLNHSIILALLLVGFLLLLFKVFTTSKSECIALAFLFLFLGAYPAIQFHFRHFFYLEFIWVLCLISIICIPRAITGNMLPLKKFLAYSLTFIATLSIVIYSLLQSQDFALSYEVQKLLKLPRKPILLSKEILSSGDIYYKIPIPQEHLHLIEGNHDAMTPSMQFIGSQWDVRTAATRYLLSLNGEQCRKYVAEVSLVYKHSDLTWQPLDSSFFLPINSNSNQFAIIFSGFYRGTQHLEGILIPKTIANCGLTLEALVGKTRIPYQFSAKIINDDILMFRHKGFGEYEKKGK
jgi:hypothetical protein